MLLVMLPVLLLAVVVLVAATATSGRGTEEKALQRWWHPADSNDSRERMTMERRGG